MGEGLALHMHVCMPIASEHLDIVKAIMHSIGQYRNWFQNMRDQQWNKMIFHFDAFTDNSIDAII